MSTDNQVPVSTKRSLISTMVLIATMIRTSPRRDEEKAASPFMDTLFDPNWTGSEIFTKGLEELTQQGYVTPEGKLTPFGEKVALQAIQNSPDYRRIASNNVNAAFAMLFTAGDALREMIKNKISPGGKTDMYDRAVALKNWLNENVE